MRKLCWVAWIVLASSSAWALPVGPGGRLYMSRSYYNSVGDCVTQLLRVDVDTSWSVAADCGVIAQVTNSYNLNPGYLRVTSPEILHPRANADGGPTGGDGSVFMAGYFDNGDHTRYYKITPTGTVSVMHPGVGNDSAPLAGTGFSSRTASTGGFNKTYGAAYVVDHTGQATGRAGAIVSVGAHALGANVWYDMNSNDVLTDPGDVWTYPFYDYLQGDDDAEIGGAPSNSRVQDTLWYHGSYDIHYTRYTGTADCHTWSPNVNTTVFYAYSGVMPPDFRFLFRNNGIAVGDTDNDGFTDVYALTTDPQLTPHNGGTICRMADKDADGNIDCSTTDLCRIIYDDLTVSGAENNIANYSTADLELVKDPTTGKWTLLLLQRGDASSAIDGRLVALELADNGDLAGGASAYKLITTIETGTGSGAGAFALYGLEFDGDPVPEPATLLLIGTGALGVFAYVRRRRMT